MQLFAAFRQLIGCPLFRPYYNKQQQSVCPGHLLFIIGISAYFYVFSLCFQLSTISACTLRAFGKSRKNKPCSLGKKNTSVTFSNDWAEGFTQTPRPDCAVTKSPFSVTHHDSAQQWRRSETPQMKTNFKKIITLRR